MPYIPAEQRKACDPLIDELAGRINGLAQESASGGAFAGLLNYACTRLALQVARRHSGPLRYWLIALLTGVFHNLADEFYRRLAAPYEDRQLAQNGDVDLIAQYLAEIEKMG
jgi:hypothetical protein